MEIVALDRPGTIAYAIKGTKNMFLQLWWLFLGLAGIAAYVYVKKPFAAGSSQKKASKKPKLK